MKSLLISAGTNDIDISDFRSGIYFFKIELGLAEKTSTIQKYVFMSFRRRIACPDMSGMRNFSQNEQISHSCLFRNDNPTSALLRLYGLDYINKTVMELDIIAHQRK